MRRPDGRVAYALLGLALAMVATPAKAETTTTLGQFIYNIGGDITTPLMALLISGAYLGGFFLVVTGLIALKQASDRDGQGSFANGILRITGGSFLVSLPGFIGMGLGTIFSSITGYQGSLSSNAPGSVTDCMSSTTATTCVAQNFAQNVVPIGVEFIFILFYVVGTFMIIHALHSMAVSHSNGQRQQTSQWVGRIVLGVVSCQMPAFLSGIQSSLGIGSGVLSSSGAGLESLSSPPSLMSYTAPASSTMLSNFSTLISWCFVILVLFGVISVARGMMQIRSVIEGGQRDGVNSGIVHIGGGVLLCNAKVTSCAIMLTFVGNGVGFCN